MGETRPSGHSNNRREHLNLEQRTDMNLWTRRLGVFLLVLALAVLATQIAHRRTAHADERTAASVARRGPDPGQVASAPAPSAHTLPTSPERTGPKSKSHNAEVAFTPPPPGIGSPVLSAEAPHSAEPVLRSASAAAVAPPVSVRTFHDPNYKISFDYPASWTFTRNDGEVSTFRLDARTAAKNTRLRAVAALPANPYPASTFSSGYVYLSVTPHSNASRCAAQASGDRKAKPEMSQIAGLTFAHGHDEQKEICTVERDEIFTTLHKGACYRFDLTMNNFCGGEVSGVKDVTKEELNTVLSRLESVVQTVRFDPK